jgi:tetratricopeptide (TPR) repeat protein
MHYCPQCGARILAQARFCVECGQQLPAAGASTIERARPQDNVRTRVAAAELTTLWPFITIFGALAIFGVLMAVLILRQIPERDRLLASAPAATTETADSGQLPSNHPAVKLPKEAIAFIQETENKARARPNDLAAWDRLGDVALRAATIDSSYYPLASEAYAHVLSRDPDNLSALRGVGNIDFDQRKYDAAIAAYEHYLLRKPDDPDVRTDLGTMLLTSGSPDQAVLQYKRVLEAHPKFFEAMFNLGVAYQQIDPAQARAAFTQARKLAPDDQTRNRVDEMLASLSNGPGPVVTDSANGSKSPAVDEAPPTNFRAAVERTMRDLPIAGDKVQILQWASDTRVKVLMNHFPMDQMPPFALAKFTNDLKSGLERDKNQYKVSTPVTLEICDAASGRVMRSITE